MAKSEQEIILQYDPDTTEWTAWTDMPHVAARWRRAGWPVTVHGTVKGAPRSWGARVPMRAVRFTRAKARPITERQREALRQSRERRMHGDEATKV